MTGRPQAVARVLSSESGTSLTKPTCRKLEVWTFMKAAVSGPTAAS